MLGDPIQRWLTQNRFQAALVLALRGHGHSTGIRLEGRLVTRVFLRGVDVSRIRLLHVVEERIILDACQVLLKILEELPV